VRHLLEQISHDGSQKIPARIFPVIEFHAKKDSVATHACFVVAAWIEFTRTRRQSETPPVDAYLSAISSTLPAPSLSAADYAREMIEVESVFPEFIRSNNAVIKAILGHVNDIAEYGVISAVEKAA